MRVELTPEDFEGHYMDHTDCPLARALKRLGHKHVYVGGTYVNFDNQGPVNIENSVELSIVCDEPIPDSFVVILDI